MTLFDPGPPLEHEELSRAQKITRRNNELLAAGIHPATRRPLFVGTGETCATCTHHVVVHVQRRYHKCERHRLGPSASENSDIRVSWAACVLYEPGETAVAFRAR